MAVVSRCMGGMRASNLHGWEWQHIDLEGWARARVVRPKTSTSAVLALPEVAVPALRA